MSTRFWGHPIASSRHQIQTSRLQTSPQIILDNEQLEPYGALEISMKKTPMAHDHLRWVPESGSPGACCLRSAWQGKSTRPTGWVPKASWRKPSQSSRRCFPENAWFRVVSLQIALLVVYGIWVSFKSSWIYPSNSI